MKWRWIWWLFLPALGSAGELAQLDGEAIFLGTYFGAPFDHHHCTEPAGQEGMTQIFRCQGIMPRFHGIRVDGLRLGFHQQRLSKIWLETSSLESSGDLYRVLNQRYGQPTADPLRNYIRQWRGQINQLLMEIKSEQGYAVTQIVGQPRIGAARMAASCSRGFYAWEPLPSGGRCRDREDGFAPPRCCEATQCDADPYQWRPNPPESGAGGKCLQADGQEAPSICCGR